MKCFLGISNFLEEISSLSHSTIFLYFFGLWGRLFYFSWLFFGTLFQWIYLSFSSCFLLLFFSQLFVRTLQTTILRYCMSFSWVWSSSLSPVECHEPPSIILQALCLSDLIPWVYFSLPLYNHKGWFHLHIKYSLIINFLFTTAIIFHLKCLFIRASSSYVLYF